MENSDTQLNNLQEKYKDKIKKAIRKGLENIVGRSADPIPIATLTINKNKKKDTISYCCRDKNSIKIAVNKQEFSAGYQSVSPISDHNKCGFRVAMRIEGKDGKSTHEHFTISADIILEDDTEKLQRLTGTMSKPNGKPDHSFLANIWFPKEDSSPDNQGMSVTVEDPFKKYWPRYDSQKSKWEITIPFLPGEENFESIEWANLVIVAAARRIILNAAYEDEGFTETDFPKYKDYIPKRPVNLETGEVKKTLYEKKT